MRNPHVAIVEAAKKGRGLKLTPDEVWELYQDSAIVIRAAFIQEQEKADRNRSPWNAKKTRPDR